MSMSCLLLNLDARPTAFAKLAHLSSCMAGVRVSRQSLVGPTCIAQLEALKQARKDDFSHAVVLLPPAREGFGSEEIQRVLDALRGHGTDTTGLLTVVSPEHRNARGFQGVDGFVAALPKDGPSVAARLLVALASTGAPKLGTCLDAEDILPSLGSAASTSRLVSATWFTDQAVLVFESAEAKHVFSNSPACMAVLYCNDNARHRAVLAALCAVARSDLALAIQIAENFLIESTCSARQVSVTLVCEAAP